MFSFTWGFRLFLEQSTYVMYSILYIFATTYYSTFQDWIQPLSQMLFIVFNPVRVCVCTGGMAEKPVVGGIIGPTCACILGQQFLNLRKGDRKGSIPYPDHGSPDLGF